LYTAFLKTLQWSTVTFRNEGLEFGIGRKEKERNEERTLAVVRNKD
jgi:hypothetical protein